MPRRLRSHLPTGYFHVLNRASRKAPLFKRPPDYRAFLEVLSQGLARHPVRLVAYCILSNHWHLILGPTDPSTLSRLMHWVTVTHAVRWHRRRKTVGQGPVYQGRFKSEVLESLEHLMRATRYVERNALRAGLVQRAQDWPWCSLSARFRPTPPVSLVSTPFLLSDAWIDYVNAPRTPSESLRPGTSQAETVENRPDPLDALDDLAEQPGGLAGVAERLEHFVGRVGRGDQHHADTHVERAKHLPVIDLSRALQPREERRNRPASAIK
jgi:putative transposase